MKVSPGYKFVNRFDGGVQWYMMESKDVISRSTFGIKNKSGNLVSFNGQSISFGLSIREV